MSSIATTTPESPTMKEVLGPGWMPKLAKRLPVKDSGTLSRLVNYEATTSKHWPAVLKLAGELNPAGLAAWEAAHTHAVAA